MSGKMVLITGAGSGIGRALALEADRLGHRLILVGRREEGLRETASSLSRKARIVLADVTAHAVREVKRQGQRGGTYHLAASGFTTWFSYAKHVLAQAGQAQAAIKIKATEVSPIATSQYPTPARRPHNSRLDCRRLQDAFGLTLPPWQHGVNRLLAEIL